MHRRSTIKSRIGDLTQRAGLALDSTGSLGGLAVFFAAVALGTSAIAVALEYLRARLEARPVFFSVSRSMPTANADDPCPTSRHLQMRLTETFPTLPSGSI